MARRLSATVLALAVLAGGCAAGGGNERTVFVDFSHDEFASSFIRNFPEEIQVTAGTKLVFRQTWTGEPHTVTGGTLVDEAFVDGERWLRFFEAFDALGASGASLPNPDDPGGTFADLADAISGADDVDARVELTAAWDALRDSGVDLPDLADPPSDVTFEDIVTAVDEASDEAFGALPWAFDQDEDGNDVVAQNAGQPCYLGEGLPPEEAVEPCTEDEQQQPEFDGRQSYYNSGIIPFEGAAGNTFEVPLAEDIEPGSYMFYCAVHGFQQSTTVEVVSDGTSVPSDAEVTREARQGIEEIAAPLVELATRARAEGKIEVDGDVVEGPFAGLFEPSVNDAVVNEFIPRRLEVRADEPITWKMMGADHTISFDVPEYFPIVEFLDDGTVRINERIEPPAGGAPKPPEREGGVLVVDGGTWDGSEFWSTGLLGAEPYVEYTLRISKPGTYKYACLIHPPMVGTVVVS